MEFVYYGTATIDEALQLRKSDEIFFSFMGANIYGTVVDFIHEQDIERFQSAFRELIKEERSKNKVVVRKRDDSKETWLLINMSKKKHELNDVTPVHLEFYAITDDKSLSEDGTWRDREVYEAFFGMMSGTMLLYDSESGQLDIRAGIADQTLSLYHGTFEDWRDSFMPEKLAKVSLKEFDILCKNMKAGNSAFQHTIETNAFSKDEDMHSFSFRFRTMASGSSFRVLGCITSDAGDSENIAESSDYVMDSGLPILDKRSIINFAKGAFRTNQESTYLVIMDLDNFKTVNDTFGHLFGDEVLLRTVEIVKNCIGRMGMLGRIGGDELMIVLTSIESQVELRNLLRSIRTDIEWSFKGEREGLNVTCSIGVAVYPDNGNSYDKVFQLADRMLYIAKNKGKNRYIIYTPEIHDAPVPLSNEEWKTKVNTLKDDKVGVIQRLVEEYLVRKIVPIETEFRELAAGFELDEITMVYDGKSSVVSLIGDVYTDNAKEDCYLDYEEGFTESFDNHNVMVVNGRFNIEGKLPQLCSLFEKKGIESALFYKMMKSNNMIGYVMFAKKSRRQMWSEYEKDMLTCVGKVMELSLSGK